MFTNESERLMVKMLLKNVSATKVYDSALIHDPQFKGPCKSRSCTDVIFLLTFISFLAGWGAIACYALQKGRLDNWFTPVDSEGRRCGRDSDVLDKPYLLYFDISVCNSPDTLINSCDTTQICVSSCPTKSWASHPYRIGLKSYMPANSEDVICKEDVDKSKITTVVKLWDLIDQKKCADWYLASTPVYNRCLPSLVNVSQTDRFLRTTGLAPDRALDLITNSTEQITSSSVNEVGGKVFDDLMKSWRHIVVTLAVAVIVSIVYIALLRYIAGIMTWLSLAAVIALMITCCLLSFKRYINLRDHGPENVQMTQEKIEELGNKGLFLTITIILGMMALISLLLIVFLRKKIQVAITLIKEGSKAVCNVISALFFPLIPWVFQVCVGLWVILVWFHLLAVGDQLYTVQGLENSNCSCRGPYEYIQSGDFCIPSDFKKMCTNAKTGGLCTTAGCHFFKTEGPPHLIYLHLFNVFGFFWGIWFISGLSDLILAGTFVRWYWTPNKKDVPFLLVTSSTLTTLRYHLGTVAFGSIIIAICSFIRAIVEYAEKKTKASDNAVMKGLSCCLKCFFWCLETFLRFINKNAYIMCAIHGRNFWVSAKDAFNLVMRNIIRVVVLDKVTDFLFFVGKLVITGCVVGVSYLILSKQMTELHFHCTVPLIIIAIGAYIIASIFFGVYSMAVNTLFLCFLEDCERNDGSIEKPYFMSKNLMRILGKRNKKEQ